MVGDGGSGHLLELGVILVDHHLLGLDLGQPMPQLTLTHTRDGNVRHSGNCKTHTSRRKTFRLKRTTNVRRGLPVPLFCAFYTIHYAILYFIVHLRYIHTYIHLILKLLKS